MNRGVIQGDLTFYSQIKDNKFYYDTKPTHLFHAHPKWLVFINNLSSVCFKMTFYSTEIQYHFTI